jgi:putative Mn2+ efflux pump MntP
MPTVHIIAIAIVIILGILMIRKPKKSRKDSFKSKIKKKNKELADFDKHLPDLKKIN